MDFMTIASGSSGNCTFIGSDKTSILIDAGISKKKIGEGLNRIGIDFKDISGILITHEHIDHTRALGVISRAYSIPIYATLDTCKFIAGMKQLGEFDKSLLVPINPDIEFSIGNLTIEAHSIWHDAVDPVCYSVFHDNKKISVATDMGDYDDYIINKIKDSDALLIEANHDIRMLQAGPYPYQLKQRILGKRGHLSNEAGGRLLNKILNDHTKVAFIGHLSNENNYPDLAYEAVSLELKDNPFINDINEFNLQVAARDDCSDLYNI